MLRLTGKRGLFRDQPRRAVLSNARPRARPRLSRNQQCPSHGSAGPLRRIMSERPQLSEASGSRVHTPTYRSHVQPTDRALRCFHSGRKRGANGISFLHAPPQSSPSPYPSSRMPFSSLRSIAPDLQGAQVDASMTGAVQNGSAPVNQDSRPHPPHPPFFCKFHMPFTHQPQTPQRRRELAPQGGPFGVQQMRMRFGCVGNRSGGSGAYRARTVRLFVFLDN